MWSVVLVQQGYNEMNISILNLLPFQMKPPNMKLKLTNHCINKISYSVSYKISYAAKENHWMFQLLSNTKQALCCQR